jgi:hypothetical protein
MSATGQLRGRLRAVSRVRCHTSDALGRVPECLKLVAKAHPRVCTSWLTTTSPTNIPRSRSGWSETQGSPCTSSDLGVLNEPGRDLLRHHHTPSPPPRQLHQRQGTLNRHRVLHRRLDRSLRALRLDQDRRRNPRQSPAPSREFKHATLGSAQTGVRVHPWSCFFQGSTGGKEFFVGMPLTDYLHPYR